MKNSFHKTSWTDKNIIEPDSRFARSAPVVAAAFMLGATGAMAQTAGPTGGARSLEEVVVTAQRRSQSLQDVPVAVSAFSGEQIQNMGISNTQDLEMSTPGLVFTNTGPVAQPYLRGVGTRQTFNGLDPSVATYIEDRYAPRASGNVLELGVDVERIEVLKGPQGTLYGRNATGGAIRVIRKGVEDEFGGTLRGSVGNYDKREAAGTVNMPITDDFGVRVSGLVKRRDGYADNITSELPGVPDELDDRDLNVFSTRFNWDISDTVNADLLLDYWRQDDYFGADTVALPPFDASLGLALGGTTGRDVDETATDNTASQVGKDFSGQFKLEFLLDQVTLSSITTFSDFKMDWATESDGTSGSVTTPGLVAEESRTFSQELRAVSSNGGDLEWISGLFFYRDDHRSEIRLDSQVVGTLSQGLQNTLTTAYAAFGELTWHLSPNWALMVGGRYSVEERETQVSESTTPGYVTAGAAGLPFEAEDEWKEFTPRVVLEYQFADTLVYATYSRGFKSGGYNYPATTTPDGLDPEVLDMFELGLKGDYLDNKLRISSAMFMYEYEDLQVTRASAEGAALVFTENAANAKIRGFEIGATWLPTHALTLEMGVSVLDTEYQDYLANAKFTMQTLGMSGPGLTDRGFDADGESLLRTSDFSGFISATYDWRIGDSVMPVSLTYSYKDDYRFDFIEDPRLGSLEQDGYGLLNARVGYTRSDAAWKVAVWGRNITDEEYFDEINANFGGVHGSYGAPRTYGLDMTYEF